MSAAPTVDHEDADIMEACEMCRRQRGRAVRRFAVNGGLHVTQHMF